MTEWDKYVVAERSLFEARARLLDVGESLLVGQLGKALRSASQRGTALRLLLTLDDRFRIGLLDDLLDLASTGHADIALVRQVIQSVPPGFLDGRLSDAIDARLVDGNDEEFRRFAELLQLLGRDAELAHLVARAMASPDHDVREVGVDFSSRPLKAVNDQDA